MSKIIRVVVEYDDKTLVAEGKDAEDWKRRVDSMEALYAAHFSCVDCNWTRIEEKKNV